MFRRTLRAGSTLALLAVFAACGDEAPTTLSPETQPPEAAQQSADILANFENRVVNLAPEVPEGLMATHTPNIRIAGVGASYGNRAANTIINTGDIHGTIDRISEATFNSMSVTDLRQNYDVLLFTWASNTSLNADWDTRIKPYLELGGGVIWEDDRNVGDLAPAFSGSACCLFGSGWTITPFPPVTDGINGSFANDHIFFSSWPSWASVYITNNRGAIVGLIGEIPTGQRGRIALHGPDHDYHSHRPHNQYTLFVQEILWVSGNGGPVNQPPTADAGPDQTVEATGPLTSVTLDGSGSSDPDGDALTYTWSGAASASGATPSLDLPLGSHTFTLTVDDGNGATDSDDVTIEVVDTTPPDLNFGLSVTEIWPPNHKMVTVASGVSASDLVDGAPSVSITVTSNEDINGTGDGNTDVDWAVIDNGDGTFDVQVRSERDGGGTGRVYTITATATDASGNSSSATGEVSVPHDKGNGKKNGR